MRTRVRAAVLTAIGACILVRVSALDADPPRFLTWSGATDTDEGFYTLDARHRALFGMDAPGDFHDRVLSPLLSWGQEGWYRLFGMSAVSARGLDVACGLGCVALLAWGLRRTRGERAGAWGVLLLGLCPIFVYYNRLALQETPAALLLTAAWALWTYSRPGKGIAAFGAGTVLAMSLAVKLLCVVFLPVALTLAWQERRRGGLFALGTTAMLAALLAVWVWPVHGELARFSAFYRETQAGAGGSLHILWNVRRFLIGDALGARRGFVPYMGIFCPALALLCILAVRRRGVDPFLATWAACGILYCALSSYTPDRYYICFLPALAGMAAGEASRQQRSVQVLGTILACAVSVFWLGWGLMRPTFVRRQAAESLARALPLGATVVGNAAPALCIGTDLRAAPVQPGLSNGVDPVRRTGARYVVAGREAFWAAFWAKAEPGLCTPRHHLLTVRLASGRQVDVYRVP